jgi:hypothetical protein
MATAQYDINQGQDKTKVVVIAGGAISGIARLTVDTSKPKSEVIKALDLILQRIEQGGTWPPV